MAIAVYFHPKGMTLDKFEEPIDGSVKPAPPSRPAGSITRAWVRTATSWSTTFRSRGRRSTRSGRP